ncbi:MAG: ATP-binding protein [Bacteroidota bacterium]
MKRKSSPHGRIRRFAEMLDVDVEDLEIGHNQFWKVKHQNDGSPIIILEVDSDLSVLGLSASYLGKASADIIGKSIFDLIPEDPEGLSRKLLLDVLKTGRQAEFEHAFQNDEGQIEHNEMLVERSHGEELVLRFTIRGMSYYKKIEQALRYRINFENLLGRVSAYFINLSYEDIDEGITSALGEICQFSGLDRSFVVLFSEDQLSSSIHYEWVQEGIPPIFNDIQNLPTSLIPWLFQDLLSGKYVAVNDEQKLPDGSEALEQMMQNLGTRSFLHVPMFWQGVVIGFIGFDSMTMTINWGEDLIKLLRFVGEMIANLLQRKHSEQHIRQLNQDLESRVLKRTKELDQANKELEAFSYSISHDLRSPLRQIGSFAGLLKRSTGKDLSDRNQEFLDLIIDSAKKMDQLITDLLTFSKLDRAVLNMEKVELKQVVGEVVNSLIYSTRDRTVEWSIGDLPACQGDYVLIRQAMMNLIENALKYTRGKAHAKIQIDLFERTTDSFTIFVQDNGVGFDMQVKEEIFGVFKRLHPSADFEGTGIGLAIVKRILTRHHAKVWVEAEVDKGACFYIQFPA